MNGGATRIASTGCLRVGSVRGEWQQLASHKSYLLSGFKKHMERGHPEYPRNIDMGPFKLLDENLNNDFWCGFCKHRWKMTEKVVQRHKARLNHQEDHLKGRKGWSIGRAETWMSEPEGGCRVVRTLDCPQQSKMVAIHQRNRALSAPIDIQQALNPQAVAIPTILVNYDMEQGQSSSQPEQQQQATSSRSGSSSILKSRRRTHISRTCVSSPTPSQPFVYDMSGVNSEDWMADDW